jgi:hypothetical protein
VNCDHVVVVEFTSSDWADIQGSLTQCDLDGDAPAFHVAEIAPTLAECVDRSRRRGGRATRNEPDPCDLSRRLRLGAERDRDQQSSDRGNERGSAPQPGGAEKTTRTTRFDLNGSALSRGRRAARQL